MRLEDLYRSGEISFRVFNALRKAGFKDLDGVIQYINSDDLLKFKRIGKKITLEISDLIRKQDPSKLAVLDFRKKLHNVLFKKEKIDLPNSWIELLNNLLTNHVLFPPSEEKLLYSKFNLFKNQKDFVEQESIEEIDFSDDKFLKLELKIIHKLNAVLHLFKDYIHLQNDLLFNTNKQDVFITDLEKLRTQNQFHFSFTDQFLIYIVCYTYFKDFHMTNINVERLYLNYFNSPLKFKSIVFIRKRTNNRWNELRTFSLGHIGSKIKELK